MSRLSKFLSCLTHPTLRASLFHRVAASVEHEETLHKLAPATVVDVGANRGQFATLARYLWPDADIHCMEPLQKPREKLNKLAEIHHFWTYPVAISKKAGKQLMNVSKRDDSSSLLPIGKGQVKFFPGTEEAGHELVRTCRLDAVLMPEQIKPPALLKIDVQGGEYDVLRASDNLLPRFRWIYVECSEMPLYDGQALRYEVEGLLNSRGFYITDHGPQSYYGEVLVQSDLLFEALPPDRKGRNGQK